MSIPCSNEPRLTPTEERDLARAIEAGVVARHLLDLGEPYGLGTAEELAAVAEAGERARERFLAANVGLVVHVLHRDAGTGRDTDDLFQEGFVGLAEALESFDWARGTRFSTWAVPYVRSRVANARRLDRGGIRIPVRRMRAAAATGEPALSVCSLHGTDELELSWWRDGTAAEAEEPGWTDVLAALGELSVEERSVLAHRYGFAGHGICTQQVTSRQLGMPVKRVRATEEAAIRSLREAVAADLG